MNERADGSIDSEKSGKYSSLVEDSNSIFYKHNKTDVYVTAATIGYYKGLREKIPSGHKQNMFVSSTLGNNSEDNLWILKSIGMAILGLDALSNLRSVISLCDEYANAGIDILYKFHCESSNETSDYATMLIDILNEVGITKN